jgi:hypothetical protein
MNSDHRIKELKTRQVYYGSSMVCKLNSVNGYWWFSIYAWTENNTKFLVTMKKYNNEDPDELFQVALLELGIKGIKLGKPVLNVSQRTSI